MSTARTAKITPLPPPKKPAWLIDLSAIDLLNEKPVGRDEICKELGVSKPTLTYLILNEGLPARKMGGRWEFYLKLVRAWRANRQLQ